MSSSVSFVALWNLSDDMVDVCQKLKIPYYLQEEVVSPHRRTDVVTSDKKNNVVPANSSINSSASSCSSLSSALSNSTTSSASSAAGNPQQDSQAKQVVTVPSMSGIQPTLVKCSQELLTTKTVSCSPPSQGKVTQFVSSSARSPFGSTTDLKVRQFSKMKERAKACMEVIEVWRKASPKYKDVFDMHATVEDTIKKLSSPRTSKESCCVSPEKPSHPTSCTATGFTDSHPNQNVDMKSPSDVSMTSDIARTGLKSSPPTGLSHLDLLAQVASFMKDNSKADDFGMRSNENSGNKMDNTIKDKCTYTSESNNIDSLMLKSTSGHGDKTLNNSANENIASKDTVTTDNNTGKSIEKPDRSKGNIDTGSISGICTSTENVTRISLSRQAKARPKVGYGDSEDKLNSSPPIESTVDSDVAMHEYICDGTMLKLNFAQHPGNYELFRKVWTKGEVSSLFC